LPPDAFAGAGVYVIYYTGSFEPYGKIAQYNRNNKYRWPIYIGKAVPPGSRKGIGFDAETGPAIHKRLREHAKTIEGSDNLKLADFHCRYLAVDDVWIPLTESLLIEMFQPIWNKVLDGFGNHAPGAGRTGQKRSKWDIMHPGREWAQDLTSAPTQLTKEVEQFIDAVLSQIKDTFLSEKWAM
jgi:hypothetical protein